MKNRIHWIVAQKRFDLLKQPLEIIDTVLHRSQVGGKGNIRMRTREFVPRFGDIFGAGQII